MVTKATTKYNTKATKTNYIEQQLPIKEVRNEDAPAENSAFIVGENGELIVNDDEAEPDQS